MLEISEVEVVGWEHAIRGMRNPMNSFDKSDSWFCHDHCNLCLVCEKPHSKSIGDFEIGNNDLDLMKRLVSAGTDHRKFMRMITVYLDINAPLYWWKEFDTYKVGTVANSCSTMHKIHSKEFTLDDFSCEHLHSIPSSVDILKKVICQLNRQRVKYLETKDKNYWWQMIQLLPSSYNQKRTVMLNCEVLSNIYKSRRTHKLDEWHMFCDWIESLPYSELITGGLKDGK